MTNRLTTRTKLSTHSGQPKAVKDPSENERRKQRPSDDEGDPVPDGTNWCR